MPHKHLPMIIALLALASGTARANPPEAFTYRGPCDASAAVAVDADHFVVGNDEDAVLRIYRRSQAKAVEPTFPLSSFLGLSPDDEVDIEGAALVGKRIYWISSHGRNSKARKEPSRQRFFATDIVEVGTAPAPQLRTVGEPYTKLLDSLEESKALRPYKLARAARRAPEEEGGLNIEGLAATPAGHLLIGLRNPLPKGHALVIPLENPAAVVRGKRAQLGSAIELDLDGRGIRSIERIASAYLIVAGPPADEGSFALYRWSGSAGDAPQLLDGIDLDDLRPEALFAVPGSNRVQLLSDDGGVKTAAGVECKRLLPGKQTFRSLTLTP